MATRQRAVAEKIEADFVADLLELAATAKAGGLAAVKAKFGKPAPSGVERIGLPLTTAKDVAAARRSLGVSQPVFAKILGASVQAVRAWEQGAKPPSGMARRLIGEIRHDPAYWRKRFALPDPDSPRHRRKATA